MGLGWLKRKRKKRKLEQLMERGGHYLTCRSIQKRMILNNFRRAELAESDVERMETKKWRNVRKECEVVIEGGHCTRRKKLPFAVRETISRM